MVPSTALHGFDGPLATLYSYWISVSRVLLFGPDATAAIVRSIVRVLQSYSGSVR